MNKQINPYIQTEVIRDITYLKDNDLNDFGINGLSGYIEVDNINLTYFEDTTKFITLKMPKKIKIDYIKTGGILKIWLLDRINKRLSINNINYIKLFEKLNLKSGMVYYTCYGFGYSLIGGRLLNDRFKIEIENIKKFLDNLNIKYYCENSVGGWVYRFKISQSQKNINLIKNKIGVNV